MNMNMNMNMNMKKVNMMMIMMSIGNVKSFVKVYSLFSPIPLL